jgi:dihydropteroate synthase
VNKLGSVKVGGKNPVRIMGILNTSSESFYKKSIFTSKQEIEDAVCKMEEDGVDFVDIGGMSTAPYLATMVSEKVESKRITNAIKIIQKVSNLPISIDTCRANVARNALEYGVEIINDISGLKYDQNMLNVIEEFKPSLVLSAYSKQQVHGNLLAKTKQLFKESLHLAKSSGISNTQIVLDPAIGFFRKSGTGPFFTKIKSNWIDRDLLILQNLHSIKLGFPLMVSVSNKSFIGKLLKKENPSERLFGSLAAETIAVLHGADVIRTHNVKETKDVITIAEKISSKKIKKGL